MAIQLDDLSPYESLLTCEAPARWGMAATVAELEALAKALKHVKTVFPAKTNPTRHGVASAFFYYLVEDRPSWLTTSALKDHVHELAMVFKRKNRVVLLATETRLRDRMRRSISVANGSELGRLTPTPRAILNAAFVRGSTKTAWLSSIARRSDIRADSKALGGTNLRYALDPLGDQNYSLSASVTELPNKAFRQPIGAAPRKGSIWAGASTDGDALCHDVSTLLDIIDSMAATPVSNPIPVLAAQLDDTASLQSVTDAYAAAMIPGELLDVDLDPILRADAEKWSRLELDVQKTSKLDFEAAVTLTTGSGPATDLGQAKFTVDISNPMAVTCTAATVKCPTGMDAEHDAAIDAINQHPDWIKVWYDSGHTLTGNTIAGNHFRHFPFDYTWIDFSKFDVTEEKPRPLNATTIGTQKSLFCWVAKSGSQLFRVGKPAPPSGWLACNDGSMEIADFIHLDTVAGVPELTLIHVKACGNGNATRPVAIGDFEIVTSQAQKNLYFLYQDITTQEFCDFLGKGVQQAVYHNGAPATRAAMLKELAKVAANYRRRVVILQPRITKSALTAARAGAKGKNKRIIQQLDLLLLGVKTKCTSFGADLVIVGDDC